MEKGASRGRRPDRAKAERGRAKAVHGRAWQRQSEALRSVAKRRPDRAKAQPSLAAAVPSLAAAVPGEARHGKAGQSAALQRQSVAGLGKAQRRQSGAQYETRVRTYSMNDLSFLYLRPTRQFTIVDAHRFDKVIQFRWHLTSKGYVVRSRSAPPFRVRLHRAINGTPEGMETHHINGNKLDNRECNLCSMPHGRYHGIWETHPRKSKANTSSHFQGVSWNHRSKRWQSQITIDRKRHYLGSFRKEGDAWNAYKEAAFQAGKSLPPGAATPGGCTNPPKSLGSR